ncbi:MAG: hypothetical protein A2Z32_03670 [Chloroflexi bacterium RBG_16_69_14]|nr:MAG: hypothetical protein A2Z32_03670 [Chloroflexi bacterium RBG_16_69_14]
MVARIRDLDPSAKVIHQDGSHQKWRLTTGASIVVPIHYRATYTFDGRGWIVQFDEPDIATFGRSLAAAKAHARSLLAVWLEVDDLAAAGAEVEDRVRLPASAAVDVEDLTRQREKAHAIRRELARGTRSAAMALRKAGLSTRDVGEILGISGARVAQIDHEPLGG